MKKKHKNYDFTTTFKSIFFNLFHTKQKQNPRKHVIYSVFTWVIWWRRRESNSCPKTDPHNFLRV